MIEILPRKVVRTLPCKVSPRSDLIGGPEIGWRPGEKCDSPGHIQRTYRGRSLMDDSLDDSSIASQGPQP